MITKLCSNRYMLRLEYYTNDGTAESITLRTLIDTYCEPGALKTFLNTKTAFWGNQYVRPSINAGNPLNDAKFSCKVLPQAAAPNNALTLVDFYSQNYAGSLDNNTLFIFGTTGAIGIVELRYEVDG